LMTSYLLVESMPSTRPRRQRYRGGYLQYAVGQSSLMVIASGIKKEDLTWHKNVFA